MAKQYIPGVSGLLTEPNPVDAPSNTLSDAENVIVDQDNKVQARHGLNTNEDEATTTFTANSSEVLSTNTTFITPIADMAPVSDSLTDYVHYSSFFKTNGADLSFFKLLEFKKSNDDITSVLFVKQRKNQYVTTSNDGFKNYLTKTNGLSNVNRYYQIAANSGKLTAMNLLPYDTVSDVFTTQHSVYLQTEDGISECNVDDLFEPTSNRFFTIRWPSFPKITHTFTKSSVYANWLFSNHKVGIKLTYYREMGYTDKEEQIYESEPSPLYEIINNGKDQIPVIDLDFLTVVNSSKLYEKWNEFTKLNNGRKFGIKIYRTKAVPITEDLPTDFFECYEPIAFNKMFTGKIQKYSTYSNLFTLDCPNFSNNSADLLDVGDIISYIPTILTENNTLTELLYSYRSVRYFPNTATTINIGPGDYWNTVDYDDIIPAKLKVKSISKINNTYVYSFSCLNLINSNYGLNANTDFDIKLNTTITSTNGSPSLLFASDKESDKPRINTLPQNTSIKFIDIAPAGFIPNTTYYIVSNINTSGAATIKLATTPNSFSYINATFSETKSYQIEFGYHPYIDNTYMIRSYRLELNLNDAALNEVGSPLYTNPNSDSAFYTNEIAPDSQFITPFKDYYIYAGIKKPLEASITVIQQPAVQQLTCSPLLYTSSLSNDVFNYYKTVPILFNTDTNVIEVAFTALCQAGNPTITLTPFTLPYSSQFLVNEEGTYASRIKFLSVPTGSNLSTSTIYYIKNGETSNTFQISTTQTGTAVTPTVTGWVKIQYEIPISLNNYISFATSVPGAISSHTNYSVNYTATSINSSDKAVTSFRVAQISGGGSISTTNGISQTVVFTASASNITTFDNRQIALHSGNIVRFSSVPSDSNIVINTDYYVIVNPSQTYPNITSFTLTTTAGASITPSVSGNATLIYYNALLKFQSNYATNLPYYTPTFSMNYQGFYVNASDTTLKQDKKSNGELYVESPILGTKRFLVSEFPRQNTGTWPSYQYLDKDNIPGYSLLTYENSLTENNPKSYMKEFTTRSGLSFTNIDQNYLTNNASFSVTMFERPQLTLELTSIDNISNRITIQTEPYYNRKGYYSLTDGINSLDDNYLTFDSSLNEANGFIKSSSNEVIKRGLNNIYNVIGEKEGQVSADGTYPGIETINVTTTSGSQNITFGSIIRYYDAVQFVGSAPGGFDTSTIYYIYRISETVGWLYPNISGNGIAATSTGTYQIKAATNAYYPTQKTTFSKWLTDSDGDIYYNISTNTLTIKNAGNFDIKKFEAPGILMIQSNETDIILFTYSSYTVSQSTMPIYVFNSVSVQFINRNRYYDYISNYTGNPLDYFTYESSRLYQEIQSNLKYFRITGLTYFFFLEGTSVDGLPLYPYSSDIKIVSQSGGQYQTGGITLSLNSITNKNIISEYYTPTDLTATSPAFTLIPHRKMSNIPVGFLQKSKNHTFIGLKRKDAGEYIDMYAGQIINKFNNELQKKGIKAYLRKGQGIGEIKIIYPDGQSIKMMNGGNASYPYDVESTGDYYPGKHSFLPELVPLQLIELANRDTLNIIENNQIGISRQKIPEIVPVGSVATIGKDSKKFIGSASNSDDLYIFKEDGIFRIIDGGTVSSNIPNVQVFQFSTNLICQAAGSVQEINDEIIFLSQYGFISISGGGVTNISGAIQRDILTLLQTSPKDRIKSFVNESKQLYYCTLINETDPSLNVKTGTYIFNTKTRQWTFTDNEVLDGLEDSQKRNLVAYRQKAIVGTSNGTSSWPANGSTHRLVSCNLSYPMQTTNYVDNFYLISRERHTDNIMFNAKDQYDYISENMMATGTFTTITNGFTISIPVSRNAFTFHYAQKMFKMFTPPTTLNMVNTTMPPTNGTNFAIVDSPIQMLANREIYVEMIQTAQTTKEYYAVKLTKFEYTGTTDNSYRIVYTFEYLTSTVPATPISLQSLKVVAGIPVKLTFNPESANNPDTNKLFQEYMVHTQTVNKGAVFSFKTDSRSNLTTDRRFAYDAAATTRNVFRTYIPTTAARGRYLIRQIKHDVPLENLIITGQTIVMRDSGSTRVQKDKD